MSFENTYHQTALIRHKLTPEVRKVACEIMERNLVGIFKGQISLDEVMESVLMNVEMHKAGIGRVNN